MTSVFTKIINGEIPAHKIAENEYAIAFLDINPEATGHTLIVPKIEIDKWHEVPEPYFSAVLELAKSITPRILKVVDSDRMLVKIIGTDVPHFHMHLIPFKPKMNKITMNELAKKIKTQINER